VSPDGWASESARRVVSAFLNRLRASGYWVPALLTGLPGAQGLHPESALAWPVPSRPDRHSCHLAYLTRSISASLVPLTSENQALHALGPLAAAGLILGRLQAIRTTGTVPRGILISPAWLRSPAGRLLGRFPHRNDLRRRNQSVSAFLNLGSRTKTL